MCRIYFVDDTEAVTNIAQGFTVMDITNNVAVAPIAGLQFFVLAWSDNYDLAWNGQAILSLYNQREWSLMGPAAIQVTSIQP
jgi:hypothetical protein